MSEDEWQDEALKIVALAEANGGDSFGARDLIFGLWSLFVRAPSTFLTVYRLLSNSDIHSVSEDISEKLCSGVALEADKWIELENLILKLAALLWTLESMYLRADGILFPRSTDELIVEYGGSRGYLLPFGSVFREEKAGINYFQKRGLRAARCIPAILAGGEIVDLKLNRRNVLRDSFICDAQLFEVAKPLDENGNDMDFSTGSEFNFFGMDFATPPDIESRLAASCGIEPLSDIVVFPELMVPMEIENEIQDALNSRPWDVDLSLEAPLFVLGGSWHHIRDDGSFDNRSPLYDGFGELLGEHKKSQPFTIGENVENIKPSNTILVVASPQLTVAVAICLDYCQEGQPCNPYDDLDVDLVIVSSMGSEATLLSHQNKAERNWHNRKTATFISQQHHFEPFGYVAGMPFDSGSKFGERVHVSTSVRKIKRKG